MGQEIELKLSIRPDSVEVFKAHPLLDSVSGQSHYLENQYFDTPDQQLTAAGAALRLRRDEGRCVQTLKTRGSNIGGLHQRDEWEFERPDGRIDLSELPASALPDGLTVDRLQPLFGTHFNRHRWLLDYQGASIEVVLDEGRILTQDTEQPISEVELELKTGQLSALLDLSLQLTERVPMVPSDMSKAERGYRLLDGNASVEVPLPAIVAQQSMESAFCALMGYELERLQRQWEVFWMSQQWRHMQAMLVTLGNLQTELEWFADILPDAHLEKVSAWVLWLDETIRPLVSWWPACFALSQEARSEPENIAVSLQQAKAIRALDGIEALAHNPRFGNTLMSLTRWLHLRAWRHDQTDDHRRASDEAVSDGLDRSLSSAWQAFKPDQFAGSTSHALSQFPAVHRLLMLCQYFNTLYGAELNHYREELQALEDNLSKLSAMDVVSRLREWLDELPLEQQASVYSWTRSQTVLLRDIKQLAGRLFESRDTALEV
ncbi:CYTH domain-containing protein [Saccharospirillum salsuginis]|nr:CYTH and CHAD domain-containing protein [Saccharospirillum salsuginis]